MPATPQDLTYTATLVYPPYSAIGYLILLSGQLLSGASGSINIAADTIATAAPHGLAIGSRIRFGGVLPIGFLGTQDYFAVPTSATAFRVAANLANAQALPAVPIDLTAASAILINEQLVIATDPINVLINKELPPANGYQRLAIANLDPAVITSPTTADHPAITLSITNTGTTQMSHRYEVVTKGGTATVGSTAGILAMDVLAYPADQTTAPSQVRDFVITLGAVAPP